MSRTAAGAYRWYVLGLMAAAYVCHSIDRQIVSVVIEPIKAEFGASDKAMGLLGGLAYAVAFSIACLPLGWLIDRVNRRTLFTAVLSVWSGLTLLCGFAGSFGSLLLMRMGVGAAEAGAQPLCVSLLSDYFAAGERSTAIGLFYLSTAIGLAASFLGGGLIAAHYGWRAAFFLAGLPGIVIAVLILATLREPVRGHLDAGERAVTETVGAMLWHFLRAPGLIHLAIAMTLTSLTVTALWTWATSLLIRIHHVPLGHAGIIVAAGALCSALGSILSGRIADRLAQAGLRRLALVPMVTTLLCVPCGIAFAYAPGLPSALLALAVTAFVMGGYLGPGYSLAMGLVRPGMRGFTGAALQLCINLLGSGMGPVVAGTFSDVIGGPLSLRPALALTMLFNLWAALHFALSYRGLMADVHAK
ncbi:spinster family MFS transporter [Flavisphingomonas formosensis]|uniref:spinster family MFS transporter n=1 Tax=Flavisphingomonas formosensis TaxID=861534 RepID=UPI0012F9AC42|nr:MFS transporter [Sphingomonas formosensis]